MKNLLSLFVAAIGLTAAPIVTAEVKPLNILLINGGCCHDYDKQGPALKGIIETSLFAKVTIENGSNNKTDCTFKSFEKDGWAKGYDLIIHNECSANVKDKQYVERILKAHREGVPSVNIHCAMHSYRWGDFKKPVTIGDDNAGWFELIGLQSSGHGPKLPVEVKYTDKKHPITVGLKDWITPVGELYNNIQLFDTATPLANGSQTLKNGNKPEAVIVWTNNFGPKKVKTFSISVGHSTEEMLDPNFGVLLNRGILWTVGKMSDDGTPAAGYWTAK